MFQLFSQSKETILKKDFMLKSIQFIKESDHV